MRQDRHRGMSDPRVEQPQAHAKRSGDPEQLVRTTVVCRVNEAGANSRGVVDK